MVGYKKSNGKTYVFGGCWPIKTRITPKDSEEDINYKEGGLLESIAKERAMESAKFLRSAGYECKVLKEGIGNLSTGEKKMFYTVYKRKIKKNQGKRRR